MITFMIIPVVNAFKDTEYLIVGEEVYYNPYFEEGERLYWKLKTYNDEFEVWFMIEN